MILDIILDIKCHIASFDKTAWYLMYRYDPEFRAYAMTKEGNKVFVQCFARVEYSDGAPYNIDYIQRWTLFGRPHRGIDSSGEDQPAIYCKNGDICYYYNGALHRDNDKPAFINKDGSVCYYKNSLIHRDDDEFGNSQPAIIYANNPNAGLYYKHGHLHRNGDKPAWTSCDGTVYYYYKNGMKHRDNDANGDDQPAVCSHSGAIKYYKNGKKHRDNDQPAVIYRNGIRSWYQNGALIRETP